MKKYTLTITQERKGKATHLITKDDGKLTEQMARSIINYIIDKSGIIIRGIK